MLLDLFLGQVHLQIVFVLAANMSSSTLGEFDTSFAVVLYDVTFEQWTAISSFTDDTTVC